MRLTRQVFDQAFPERFIPILVVLAALLLRICINPTFRFDRLGFDLAYAGVQFDIWAIQTIGSGRMLTFGGLVEFPEADPERASARKCEGFRIWTCVLCHAGALTCILRTGAGPLEWYHHTIGLLAGLVVPLLAVSPVLLPKRGFYEARD